MHEEREATRLHEENEALKVQIEKMAAKEEKLKAKERDVKYKNLADKFEGLKEEVKMKVHNAKVKEFARIHKEHIKNEGLPRDMPIPWGYELSTPKMLDWDTYVHGVYILRHLQANSLHLWRPTDHKITSMDDPEFRSPEWHSRKSVAKCRQEERDNVSQDTISPVPKSRSRSSSPTLLAPASPTDVPVVEEAPVQEHMAQAPRKKRPAEDDKHRKKRERRSRKLTT